MRDKIKNQKEIVSIAQRLKRARKKLVVINGSFDMLHLTHIRSLEEAKTQGDVLIVLLNSDKSVKQYKGSNRPINSEKERAEILSALECVDFIVLFNEINPKKLLGEIKPDVLCKGREWGKDCVERELIERHGGKVYLLKEPKHFSTTLLIDKLLKANAQPSSKAVFLDRDGTININQPEYVHRIEDFKFLPGAITALKKLSKSEYKIIIVTNQSAVGRGYYKNKDVEKLHKWLLKQLKKEGVNIDKIYFCPHRPEDKCSCRKPQIGLLLKAVKDFDISLAQSWVIGDDARDILMGREANTKTIFLGKPKSPELTKAKILPHYFAENLCEGVNIILKQWSS